MELAKTLKATGEQTFSRAFLAKYKSFRIKGNGMALDMVDMSGGCITFAYQTTTKFKTLEEMMDAFYHECLRDKQANQPFFFCYAISNPNQPRRLVIDFDYIDLFSKPLTDEEINEHHEVVREIVNEFMGGVNKMNDIIYSYAARKDFWEGDIQLQKVGIHAVAYLIFLTREQTVNLCYTLINVMQERFPRGPGQNPWDKVIDYKIVDVGLRMNWSHKAEDCPTCKPTEYCAVCYGSTKIDGKRPYTIKKIICSNGTQDIALLERCQREPILELKLTNLHTPNERVRSDFRIPPGRSVAPPDWHVVKARKLHDLLRVKRVRGKGAILKVSQNPLRDGTVSANTLASIKQLKNISVPDHDPEDTKHSLTGPRVFLNINCRAWQVFTHLKSFLCEEHKTMRITKLWTNPDRTYYMCLTDSHWCTNKARVFPSDAKHKNKVYFFSGIRTKRWFQKCFSTKDPGSGISCDQYFSPGIDIPEEYLEILYPTMYPRQIDMTAQNKQIYRQQLQKEIQDALRSSIPLPLDAKKAKKEGKDREDSKLLDSLDVGAKHEPVFDIVKRAVVNPPPAPLKRATSFAYGGGGAGSDTKAVAPMELDSPRYTPRHLSQSTASAKSSYVPTSTSTSTSSSGSGSGSGSDRAPPTASAKPILRTAPLNPGTVDGQRLFSRSGTYQTEQKAAPSASIKHVSVSAANTTTQNRDVLRPMASASVPSKSALHTTSTDKTRDESKQKATSMSQAPKPQSQTSKPQTLSQTSKTSEQTAKDKLFNLTPSQINAATSVPRKRPESYEEAKAMARATKEILEREKKRQKLT